MAPNPIPLVSGRTACLGIQIVQAGQISSFFQNVLKRSALDIVAQEFAHSGLRGIAIVVDVHVDRSGCLRREDGRKTDVAGFNTLAIGSESHCVFQGIKGKLISGSQGNAPHVGRPTGKVLGGVGGDGVRGGFGGGGSIRIQRKGLGILRFRAVCPGAGLIQRAEVDDNLLQRLFDAHSLASGHRIRQACSVDSRAVFDLAICNIVCSHNITVFDFNYLLRIKFRNLIAAILCSTRLTVDCNGLGGRTPLHVRKIQVRQGHVAGVGDLHRIGDDIAELCLLLIRCLHNGDIGVGALYLHIGCRLRGMGSAVTGGSSGGVGDGLASVRFLYQILRDKGLRLSPVQLEGVSPRRRILYAIIHRVQRRTTCCVRSTRQAICQSDAGQVCLTRIGDSDVPRDGVADLHLSGSTLRQRLFHGQAGNGIGLKGPGAAEGHHSATHNSGIPAAEGPGSLLAVLLRSRGRADVECLINCRLRFLHRVILGVVFRENLITGCINTPVVGHGVLGQRNVTIICKGHIAEESLVVFPDICAVNPLPCFAVSVLIVIRFLIKDSIILQAIILI